MHRIRAYVDTSVFGGTEDEEFAEASRAFFEQVHQGDYAVLLSEETLAELSGAPEVVQQVWRSLPPDAVEEIAVTPEVETLARAYIEADVLTSGCGSDAIHVAAATVAGADLIVSWNFRHIVNYNRIRGFNSVNVSYGYRSLTILSPLETCYGNDSKDV